MGGLTVLRALAARLPDETFVYLGDTARLPYGTKSPETVQAYALQATRLLIAEGVKMVVIACNTASAVALAPLAKALAPVPVIGVIEPGARAAVAATRNRRIAVIATEGTVKGEAYPRAIRALKGEMDVVQRPCQVFVALAEEGWTESLVTAAAAKLYLGSLFEGAAAPDTIVLGCTHFPVLTSAIREVVGKGVAIVDSASARIPRRCPRSQRHEQRDRGHVIHALLRHRLAGAVCAGGSDLLGPPDRRRRRGADRPPLDGWRGRVVGQCRRG